MIDGDNRYKLEKWIDGLSIELVKSIEAILVVVIAVAEEKIDELSLGVCNPPIDEYKFSEKGLAEGDVIFILGALRVVIDDLEVIFENDRLMVTLKGLEYLEYISMHISKKLKREVLPDEKGELFFNEHSGILYFGHTKPLGFHSKGDAPRLRLFRKLWEERKYLQKGRIKKRGEAFPIHVLAIQVGVSDDRIIAMIKGVKRSLKEREFPADIEVKSNAALLVINE